METRYHKTSQNFKTFPKTSFFPAQFAAVPRPCPLQLSSRQRRPPATASDDYDDDERMNFNVA